MGFYFNSSDVLRLYNVLNPTNSKDLFECRCIDMRNGAGVISREYIETAPKFIEWARKYNGQGNCFVGRNPRKEVGSKEIKHISCISLDIDPIRPKGVDATEEQTNDAINAGTFILAKFPGASLCVTGNGSLLLWTVANPILADYRAFEEKIKSFQDECSELIKNLYSRVKIDATQDSSRLIKLIGTVSVKGATRITRFLRLSGCAGNGDGLFRHVEGFRKSQPVSKEILLAKSTSNDRSANDYALAIHYKQSGLGPYDTLDALSSHALGRNDRRDDHLRIIKKVFNVDWNGSAFVASAEVQGGDGNRTSGNSNDGLMLYSPQSSMADYMANLGKRITHERPELPTGIKEFDGATHGLRRGEVYTVAGRPGMGKTSYLLNMANHLCAVGKRVLILSTEMSYYAIWDRLFSIGAEIPGVRFNDAKFTQEENKRKDGFYVEFQNYDLHVCDSFTPNIKAVKDTVARVKPDVVMFDHIQHIEGGEDFKTISAFTQALKQLAMSYNCAVVVASQLTRPMKAMNFKTQDVIYARPHMSDLKGCGKIEEESAFIILLYPADSNYGEDMPIIRGELVKNRFGPNVLCDLVFQKNITKFKSLEDMKRG